MSSDILALKIGVHGWVVLRLESTWKCILWSSSVVDKWPIIVYMCFPCRRVSVTKTHSSSAVEQLVTLWIGCSDSSD